MGSAIGLSGFSAKPRAVADCWIPLPFLDAVGVSRRTDGGGGILLGHHYYRLRGAGAEGTVSEWSGAVWLVGGLSFTSPLRSVT